MFFSISTNDHYDEHSKEKSDAPINSKETVVAFADELVESHYLHESQVNYHKNKQTY